MPKFYKNVDGKKFYCNEKGELVQKDGVDQEVPESDSTAVDVDSGVDEATKMLSEAMQKAIDEGDKVAVASAEKAMEAVSKFFDSVEEKAKERTPKVEVGKVETSFDVKEVEEGIAGLAKRAGNVAFKVNSVKELDAIGKSTDRTDLTGVVIEPAKDPGITRAPVRATFIENLADVVETTSDTVKWTEVTGASGAPATTAELAAIPQKDYTFQSYSTPVEKVAVINKHSVELLKYGPELVAAVRSMLQEDLNIVVDGQLLSGNGTAPNLQGVLGVAEELDATAVGSQEIANPNLFDVIRVAATKIMVAGKGKFIPNYVVLNPVDSEALDLTKNADGDYIMPAFYSADGQLIKGARVVENTGITAGTFLIGDFRHLHVRPNGGAEIEISNSDSDDFQKDLIAIKIRRFLASYVRNNDSGAFMFGDISDVITALTPA